MPWGTPSLIADEMRSPLTLQEGKLTPVVLERSHQDKGERHHLLLSPFPNGVAADPEVKTRENEQSPSLNQRLIPIDG
ncbi:MAG: hypothetical protein F6K28_17205 [Microcoleus sp. SIO2G3]|nr:hypothetical protein [Microcoleus sp. SIO2G3]